MALQRQPVDIKFAAGLDTKSDPWRVQVGHYLTLQNGVFTKDGRLDKRNGFGALSPLPTTAFNYLCTYNGGLVAVGQSLQAYSSETMGWTNRGAITPIALSTMPVVRTSQGQTTCDIAVAASGLACSTWLDTAGNSFYQVFDSSTGQIVVNATQLPATATLPRAFALSSYFIITFLATVGGVTHLQYVAIPVATPSVPSAAVDLSLTVPSLTAAYDAYVGANALYWACQGSGQINLGYLTSTLSQPFTTSIASTNAANISVTVDVTPTFPVVVWLSYYVSGGANNVYTTSYNSQLTQSLAPFVTGSGYTPKNLTSAAANGSVKLVMETATTTPDGAYTGIIYTNTITNGGTATNFASALYYSSLASKPFYMASTNKYYVLVTSSSANQPTYFMVDIFPKAVGQSDALTVVAKLAPSNGGGVPINQILPSVNVFGTTVQVAYLYKSSLAAINKTTNSANPVAAIYSQLGMNIASFTFGTSPASSVEIGGSLSLSGGIVWQYDGVKPVELGFHLYPDNMLITTAGSGGAIAANTYFYQFCYEWTDAAGMIHRSAPSIPYKVITTGATSQNTILIPWLFLTSKNQFPLVAGANPYRIVGYRWSATQQTYYRFTSITSPNVFVTNSSALNIVDTLADSAILGNDILYTTGGVLEDSAPPASSALALFKSRVFSVNAEDGNTLSYSKQVIAGTPVEFSPFLSYYTAPTTGAQGSTGRTKALSAMDDKLIVFKQNAVYYITGQGPDNTGANSDFSDPIFITSTVGCNNPNSIVFIPNGLMFQSDKGIWLLDRSLNTSYIGAPVEQYNSLTITSAVNVPATNQVRFTLSNGVMLMYDYYFNRWGTFNGINAVTSTIYQSYHTAVNAYGQALQETPGIYLDGSNPVLMSFTTSWINLAGLQGFQRAYTAEILGTYLSPHKLQVSIAYDYNPSPSQTTLISPNNYAGVYGTDALYGSGTVYGGGTQVEEWRIFFQKQKCESFQLTVSEQYDPSLGVAAGAGLTFSGINLQVGVKASNRPNTAGQSVG